MTIDTKQGNQQTGVSKRNRRRDPVKRANKSKNKSAAIAILDKKVIKLQKQVMGNTENKYVDQSGTVTLTNAPTLILLSNMAQGTDVSLRVGGEISFVNISGRISAYNGVTGSGPSASNNQDSFRWCIIKDESSQGSLPGLGDVFQSSANYLSYLNDDNKLRFKVIHNQFITLPPAGESIQIAEFFKKLKEKPTTFSGVGGAQANCYQNHYYMVIWGKVVDAQCAINYYIRMKYKDA